jgi:hypothetical protein
MIAHVASFLPKEDILNLRLTCRRCQQTTQRAFADAFFSTVATDFCKRSLQRLERIAFGARSGPRAVPGSSHGVVDGWR